MISLPRFLLLGCCLTAACSQLQPASSPAEQPEQAAPEDAIAEPVTFEETRSQLSAQIESTVTAPTAYHAETIYELLIAEVAGQRNRADITLGNYMRQAHKTRDPEIVERATHIAQYIRAHQAALEMATLWTQVSPDSPKAHETAALELLYASQYVQAIEELDLAMQLGSSVDFEEIIQISRILPPSKRQTILLALDGFITRHPDYAYAYYAKAMLYEQAEQDQQALDCANQALKLLPKRLEFLILKSQIQWGMKAPKPALKSIKTALKYHPKSTTARLLYAQMLADHGNLGQTRKQFAKLLKAPHEDQQLKFSLAIIAWEHRMNKTAGQYFQELADNGFRPDEAYTYLARIAEAQEQTDAAIGYYKKVRFGPNYAAAQIQTALLLSQLGELEQAQQLLEQLRNQLPQVRDQAYMAEAQLLTERQQTQSAFELLNQALSELPDNANLLYTRAMLRDQLDDIEGMETDLRLILRSTPNNPIVLNALGYTLANKTERFDEALEFISRAASLQPNDPAVVDSMGWIQFRMGNHSEAIRYLNQAYSLSQDPEIAAHLGEALWASGDQDSALKIWSEALDSKPKNRYVQETMQRLAPEYL